MKSTTIELNDNDYQWIIWRGPEQRVVGATQTVYGLKSPGDRFLCHVQDIAAFGTQVSPDEITLPVLTIKPLPAPKRIKT